MRSMMSTSMASTEQEEPQGLGALYAAHAPGAVRLAYLLTGDRALAQDLVQDAFARLIGRLAHVRSRDSFDAYLSRMIVNLSRDHFRRKKIERAYLAKRAAEPRVGSTVEPDVAAYEAMRAALLNLPERQRAAIVLRYYEDMSDLQVSEILRCRPATVRSLVSRGVQALRAGQFQHAEMGRD